MAFLFLHIALQVSYKTYQLPFVHPFTISGGRTKTHQPTFIVELSLGPFTGYGEAPAIAYYNTSVEQMAADLDRKKRLVEKFAFTHPDRYWHYLHHLFPNNPFLVCALDMAAWDMFGKMNNQPLFELWGTAWKNDVLTDYTIGIDTIEKMVKKMKEKPWPIYKIKLGTAEDIKIVRSLREHTDAILRVDANAGWKVEEALQIIPELATLNVELVEQPLAKDDWEGMKVLYKSSSLPLMADESCVFEDDVEKCREHFHGINIKLTKCSGATPALRMIEKARSFGMKVMMGSMNESSIGSAAIAHFLPQLDYIDCDGTLLLAEDIASGLNISEGVISVGAAPGLGIRLL
jgi:L-alanine-DL-glutamate epimerase-like enolase superfamily enzyme